MYFYKYKVNGYGEDVGEYIHEGLVYGMNFTEAVDILENYYDNEIINLYVEPAGEEDSPYLLNEQYKINKEEVIKSDTYKWTGARSENSCRKV